MFSTTIKHEAAEEDSGSSIWRTASEPLEEQTLTSIEIYPPAVTVECMDKLKNWWKFHVMSHTP